MRTDSSSTTQVTLEAENSAVLTTMQSLMAQYMSGIQSDSPAEILASVKKCRMLLSREKDAPVNEVISSGFVPILVALLGNENGEEGAAIQFEAAWALTNICSGSTEQTETVIAAGALPILVKLLDSPSSDVQEQCVWALGNVAGDSPKLRDLVHCLGALVPIARMMMAPDSSVSLRRNATWVISNLCRGKPYPGYPSVAPAIPGLVANLLSCDDEIVTDSAWAISYLADVYMEAVIEGGAVPRLIALTEREDLKVVTPALRALGNIITGTHSQTQVVIDAGMLEVLHRMVKIPKTSIIKESSWIISNITAGTQSQIDAVLASGLIIPLIAFVLETPPAAAVTEKVRKEVMWALANLTALGTNENIAQAVEHGLIPALADGLRIDDAKIKYIVIDALDNVLKAWDSKNPRNTYASILESCDVLPLIEELQYHKDVKIYDRAASVLETIFAVSSSDSEDETWSSRNCGRTLTPTDSTGADDFVSTSLSTGWEVITEANKTSTTQPLQWDPSEFTTESHLLSLDEIAEDTRLLTSASKIPAETTPSWTPMKKATAKKAVSKKKAPKKKSPAKLAAFVDPNSNQVEDKLADQRMERTNLRAAAAELSAVIPSSEVWGGRKKSDLMVAAATYVRILKDHLDEEELSEIDAQFAQHQ